MRVRPLTGRKLPPRPRMHIAMEATRVSTDLDHDPASGSSTTSTAVPRLAGLVPAPGRDPLAERNARNVQRDRCPGQHLPAHRRGGGDVLMGQRENRDHDAHSRGTGALRADPRVREVLLRRGSQLRVGGPGMQRRDGEHAHGLVVRPRPQDSNPCEEYGSFAQLGAACQAS